MYVVGSWDHIGTVFTITTAALLAVPSDVASLNMAYMFHSLYTV